MNQRGYSRAVTRLSSLGAAICVVIAALIIGCGGGGGGGIGSTNSTATTSTATTSTATATTSTATATTSTATATTSTATATTSTATATPSTATSSGSTGNGLLPPNVLIYADVVGSASPPAYNVMAINPNGSNPHALASNVPVEIEYFAMNPIVNNQYVFAAQASPTALFGIYISSNGLTMKGATQLVAPTYFGVVSLQITEDATKIVYTGVDSSGQNSNLFVEPITGGTPLELDNSGADNFADVSPGDSNTVVFSELIGGAGQLFYKKISAGASGAATQLTNDSFDDENPVFTHDGTAVVFNEGVPQSGGAFDIQYPTIISMSTGKETKLLNPDQVFFEQASPNTGATFVGYSGQGNTTIGLYTQATTTSAKPTLILNDEEINTTIGVYWTGNNGRGLSMNLSLGSKRSRIKAALREKSLNKARRAPVLKRW